jgi:uncharacterized glyoxalase superfamily protein PhnB
MVQAIPEGVGNVVPYLCVRGAKKAIEFYQAAFGAEVVKVMPMGDDLVGHADLKIGSSRLYLADEMPAFGSLKSPKTLKGSSVNVHLWVEDSDAAFAKAVAAGAKVEMPLVDQFWGDRYGMVSDPFGHMWAISSHKEDLTPEEVGRRGAEAMAQMQAAPKPKAKPKGLPKPSAKTTDKPKVAAVAKASPAPDATNKAESKKDKKHRKAKKAKAEKKAKKDKKRKKKSKR